MPVFKNSSMRAILASLVAATSIVAPAASQPASTPANAPAYHIAGFRTARFGMTPAEVRAAIAADFSAASKITETANPLEGTTALQITIPDLPPGPGAATIGYVFGATAKRLIQINVLWLADGEATPAQREAMSIAAVQLTDYFHSLAVRPKARADARPIGANALRMFAAADDQGAGVELVASGIPFRSGDGSVTSTPSGPAALRITYLANTSNPDIKRIAPGAF